MRRLSPYLLLPLVVGCSHPSSPIASPQADRVVIVKSAHTLTLYSQASVLRTFYVALGRGHGGPKQREGDHETPEGLYLIDAKNPHSRFYKALHVSYPNAQDQATARSLGAAPGGEIMIHGIKNGLGGIGSLQSRIDWTDGCIALTDAEMDEVWKLVPTGTPVEIRH